MREMTSTVPPQENDGDFLLNNVFFFATIPSVNQMFAAAETDGNASGQKQKGE